MDALRGSKRRAPVIEYPRFFQKPVNFLRSLARSFGEVSGGVAENGACGGRHGTGRIGTMKPESAESAGRD